jgi:hypothetical protein
MSGGDFYAAPKIVTVRKAHVCAYCGETIPAGTHGVLMESGLWMRLFWKRYACPRCQPYVSEFWSWQGLESETSNGISTSSCGSITAMCG